MKFGNRLVADLPIHTESRGVERKFQTDTLRRLIV